MKKILCSLLVVVMCLTAAPLQGFVGMDWNLLDFSVKASAETSGYYTYTVTNGEATITKSDTSISGDVTIPSTLGGYPVTSIGESAFERCNGITNVTLSEGITKINRSAFWYCDNLTTVTIPASVSYIAECPFYLCDNIVSFSVDENNDKYSNDEHGVLFRLGDRYKSIVQYPAGSSLEEYILPDGTTGIDMEAFRNAKNLKKVSIPVSVSYIAYNPFDGCDNIASFSVDENNAYYYSDEYGTLIEDNNYGYSDTIVQYPAGSSWEEYIVSDEIGTIDTRAFRNAKNLKTVTISEGVELIEFEAFKNCTNLTTVNIPSSVKKWESQVFWYCSNLENVTISEGVEVIGASAFRDCTSLKQIVIPGSVTEMESGVFGYCESLISADIPDSVTTWGDACFAGCKSLKSVSIGKGISLIPNTAFIRCENLETVTLNPEAQIKEIGSDAFSDCYKFKGIDMTYVTAIGDRAFRNCYELKKAEMPGVITIGKYAFQGCSSLERVDINSGVTSIGADAFFLCENLSEISVDSENKYYSSDDNGVLYNKGKTVLILFPTNSKTTQFTFPESVITIAAHAFANCNKLESIIASPALEIVDYYAFYGELQSLQHVAFYEGAHVVGLPGDNHHYRFNPDTDITVNTVPGTCQQPDMEEVVCSCGYVYSSTPAELGDHEYLPEVTTPATHTETGVITYKCIYCQDFYTEVIPKLDGHSYTSEITTPATHTAAGVMTYACECGDTYTEVIPKLSDEHSYTSEITTQPTHKETGVRTYTCECGDFYTETVAVVPHSYSTAVTEPTCTERGYTTYTCVCGDSYKDNYTAKTKHTYTPKVTKQPTHKETGVKTFTCVCGDAYTEPVAKIPHSYSKIVTAPTCTKQGYTTYTCACGDSYVSDYVGTIAHSYTSVVTTPATHLSEGIRTYTCSTCGYSYPETIAKTPDHTHMISTVVAPTCENEGYTVYVCECGDSYYGDYKAETGHSYDGDICRICGESKVDNCSCNCHKKGISGLIWKILRFFYKLFGMNKVCRCGVVHY